MAQNSFHVNSAAISDRGLSEKRPQNEDSYLEMPARGLFVVADGVGGAQAGDVASQMAVEILGEAFTNLREGADVEDLMRFAIESANGAIHQMSQELPQLSTMATTVVALHIAGNIATIGHAGDSRLYRLDSHGSLSRETQDHSVVEEEVRAGRMTPEQAENHPSKNVICRALGAESTVEVDMKTMMFEPNTTFFLCSDGITRHITDPEIRELLLSGNAPAQICEEMKRICYNRGAEDNLTAVIVNVVEHSVVELLETDDENTVTAMRPPLVNSAIFAQAAAAAQSGEIQTQNLSLPQPGAIQTAGVENTADFSNQANPPVGFSETASDGNATQAVTHAADNAYTPQISEKFHVPVERKGGKFLPALLGLVVGSLIGAAAYYFLARPQPAPAVVQEPPKITQMQTPNIAYSAFEDNRRNVDRNPAQYVSASGAAAQNAEDFYLLGRAYLLQGKYVEAKDALTKAKQNLPQMSGNGRQMLANEINFGLSMVDSPYSKRFLDIERDAAAQTDNPANSANANFSNASQAPGITNN